MAIAEPPGAKAKRRSVCPEPCPLRSWLAARPQDHVVAGPPEVQEALDALTQNWDCNERALKSTKVSKTEVALIAPKTTPPPRDKSCAPEADLVLKQMGIGVVSNALHKSVGILFGRQAQRDEQLVALLAVDSLVGASVMDKCLTQWARDSARLNAKNAPPSSKTENVLNWKVI